MTTTELSGIVQIISTGTLAMIDDSQDCGEYLTVNEWDGDGFYGAPEAVTESEINRDLTGIARLVMELGIDHVLLLDAIREANE